jgi:hypothetical protein
MAIHQRNIRGAMEAEANPLPIKHRKNLSTLFQIKSFREISGVIEAYLDQSKSILNGEIKQKFIIAESSDICKSQSALNRIGDIWDQVLRSFFFAAGKRTLFNMSL